MAECCLHWSEDTSHHGGRETVLGREDCSTVGGFVADHSEFVSVEIPKNKSAAFRLQAVLPVTILHIWTSRLATYLED